MVAGAAPLLIGIGLLHTGYGLVAGWSGVVDVLSSGVGGADQVDAEAQSWFWWLVAGDLVSVGQLTRWL